MATRIYTQSSGIPDVTPTDWEFAQQINPVTVPGTLTRNTGAAMTSKAESTGVVSPIFRAMGRTILGPLSAATISGTVTGQMRGMQNNNATSATLAMAIKLVQPSGADRGVLLAPVASDATTAGNELVTNTLTNTPFKTLTETVTHTLTSHNATDGDYLVIEWGFRSATTTDRTVTLSYGNNSATDLTAGNTTETTPLNPWWEFSANFALLPITRNLTAAVAGASTTPAARGYGEPPLTLPTTNLTLHVDASTNARLFTTANGGGTGVHTGAVSDGTSVLIWDDEGDGVADVLFFNNFGPVPWRSTTPLMALPCLAFDGSTSQLETRNQAAAVTKPLSDFITAGAYTILVAFYPVAVATSAAQVTSNVGVVGDNNSYVGLYLKDEAGTYKLFGYTFDGTNRIVPATGLPLTLGTSYVAMLRYGGGTLALSLNGGAESTVGTGTTISDVTARLYVGRSGAAYFQGRVGEVAVYNAALSGAALAEALTYFQTKWLPTAGQQRLLTAQVLGASTTPASLLTTDRLLLATVSATSTTPASASTVLRLLVSGIAGASVTSDAAHALPILRSLTAVVTGTSLIPASEVSHQRTLVAVLVGSSTTPVSLQTMDRALSAVPLATSLTAEAVFDISGVRLLTATLSGSSMTPASLVIQLRSLAASSVGLSTTPAAAVTVPDILALSASVQASTQTTDAPVWGIFTRLITPVGANHGYLFPVTDTLLLPGVAHGLGTAALHIGVYDSQTPCHRLRPGSVTVDASTYEVQITLAQPQACLVVLNAGRPAVGPTGNYSAPFGPTTVLTIPASLHGLGTPTLLGTLYDDSTPRIEVDAGTMTVDTDSATVEFTFAQPQSGVVVLCGSMGSGGTVNSAVALPGTALPVSIPQATHGLNTANVLVTVYDARTPRHQVQPGRVTVDATTHEVVLSFAQAQAGTVVLNGSVQQAEIRLLTASILGTSDTASTDSVELRSLLATPLAQTLTPEAFVQVGRTLTAIVTSTSLTAEATSVVTALRALTASVSSTTTTPESVVSIVRALSPLLTGMSSTPEALTAVQRPLLALVGGTSTTRDAAVVLTALRALTASVSGSSATAASVSTTARVLQAQATGTSTTPPVEVTIALLRTLTASLSASSLTPDSRLLTQRPLTASIMAVSATPALLQTAVRDLSASISSASVTPPVVVPVQERRLSTQVLGATLTPAVVMTTSRRLLSALVGTSVTPAGLASVQRPLVASLSATTTTRAAAVVVSGLRALSASLLGASTTPASLVTQHRALVSAAIGITATPVAVVRTQRLLVASSTATSTTSVALFGNVIVWQSQMSAASATPPVLGRLTRTLTALAQNGSATPPAAAQQVRDLQSVLVGLSLTPSSASPLVRRLGSQCRGESITSASAHALTRDLAALVAGHTQTSLLLVTTARPLLALVEDVSRVPDILLIPNSGQMACRASILGESLTAEARLIFLPMQRVAQAGNGTRIAALDGTARTRIGRVGPRSRTATVA